MPKVIMGSGGFNCCLSEPQSVSALWKETAQTRVFVLSPSLLLNHLETQSSKAKLLLPKMPVGIVAFAFTLLSKQLYLLRYHSILKVMNGRHVNTAKFVWPVGYRIDWFLLIEP